MKKGKLLALALAGAITFMGAGYAAWQDNVNINATVTTGNMDVKFVEIKSSEISPPNEYTEMIIPEISEDGMTFTVGISNFYPAADVTDYNGDGDERPVFKIKARMINEGSIPAKITGFDITHTGKNSDKIYENLYVEDGYICKVERDILRKVYANGKWKNVENNVINTFEYRFGKGKDIKLDDFKNEFKKAVLASDMILEEYSNIVVVNDLKCFKEEKEERRFSVYGINLYLDPEADNDTQESTCILDFNFTWKPFNQ